MDSQFPDIFAKPGQFLPGIFDHQNKNSDFKEGINIEQAKVLQEKLLAEREALIKKEAEERKANLQGYTSNVNESEEEKALRIKRGLEQMGLEDGKQEVDVMEKRKELFANIKKDLNKGEEL